VQPLGSPAEVQLFGDGYEIPEMTKLHGFLPTRMVRAAPGLGQPGSALSTLPRSVLAAGTGEAWPT
jgi:hypothetical protein